MKLNIIIFCAYLLSSCTTKVKPAVLSPNNLSSWIISVDENTDSTFQTPKGALLKITKGTFARAVNLEIKEAYTMADMLLGGLATETNGRQLSSGGMIYINPKDDDVIELMKPIKLALPTSYLDPEMQVYKGEYRGDTINWISPNSLPNNSLSQQNLAGQQLFEANCANCHKVLDDFTAPALAGLQNRGKWNDRLELYKYIRDPHTYMQQDEYAKALQRKWKTMMTSFPQLRNDAIDAIMFYINNETYNPNRSTRNGLRDSAKSTTSVENQEDLCSDTTFFEDKNAAGITGSLSLEILEDSSIITQEMATSNEDFVQNDTLPTPIDRGKEDIPAYIFEIESLGWYNIDKLLEGVDGSQLCDLQVRLTDSKHENLTVYVIFPLYQQLTQGRLESGIFVFESIGDKIPLVMGSQGIAIAFGKVDGEFSVGVKSFVTAKEQIVDVQLKKSSEAELLKLIKENRIENVDLLIRSRSFKVNEIPCNGMPSNTLALP